MPAQEQRRLRFFGTDDGPSLTSGSLTADPPVELARPMQGRGRRVDDMLARSERSTAIAASPGEAFPSFLRRGLLVCGVLSSLVYVAINVLGAMRWEGYSSTSQTVSELSAIDAPSRPLVVLLGVVYDLLVAAFGIGVWRAAGARRALRVTAGLLVAVGAIGPFWPPMHLRGADKTLTDTMHVAFTAVTVLFMLLAIGSAATALGKHFRLYSIVTIVILLVFGALAGLDGPRVGANLPTPWLGVTERINIGAYLVWVAVLATTLMRGEKAPDGQ